MRHDIAEEKLGPMGEAMTDAIQKCVHCGFCLPGCPTYQELGQEQDSPRGRILLMKEVLEGNLTVEEAIPSVDRCLGCLACETNCPSGVGYGELISPFRDYTNRQRSRSWLERLRRQMVLQTLPYPSRFRLAMKLGKYTQWIKRLLPRSIRPMLEMIPPTVPSPNKLVVHYPAEGERRGRVALLVGCAQQVLAPEINLATIRVLNRNGIEVVVPPDQKCCGALAWHIGESEVARRSARKNLSVFPEDVDAIISNAAGCGSGMKEYPLLFKGSEYSERAEVFSSKVLDVSVYLAKLDLVRPGKSEQKIRVGYHDACHLAHAQQVRSAPRRMLSGIENLELVEIADSDTCCGSAGTYNIDQPELAAQLGKRKADVVLKSGCQVLAAGNIGCLVQIEKHLLASGAKIPVMHPIEILDRVYRGDAVAR